MWKRFERKRWFADTTPADIRLQQQDMESRQAVIGGFSSLSYFTTLSTKVSANF